MAKFLVTTQNQTITKQLIEAENEEKARLVASGAEYIYDDDQYKVIGRNGVVIETVAQTTKGVNVEPYSSLVKAKGIVDASGAAVA